MKKRDKQLKSRLTFTSFFRTPLCLCVSFLCVTTLSVRAQETIVSNVRAAQVPGTHRVEIFYDLANDGGLPVVIQVRASTDGGTNYSITPPVESLSGHLGIDIASGTNRKIVFDAARAGAPFSSVFARNLRFRVELSDGSGINLVQGRVLHLPLLQDLSFQSNHNLSVQARGNPSFGADEDGSILLSNKESWVEMTPKTHFNPRQNPFTVTMWFKVADNDDQSAHRFLSTAINRAQTGMAGAQWWSIQLRPGNVPEFAAKSGTSSSQTECRSVTNLSPNRWYHLAAIRRGQTTIELWIDGLKVREVTNNSLANIDIEGSDSFGTTNDPSLPVFIGYNPGYAQNGFSGSIKHFRYYTRALDEVEVRHLNTFGL